MGMSELRAGSHVHPPNSDTSLYSVLGDDRGWFGRGDEMPKVKSWEESLSGRLCKQLEEWEEEYPTGTRVLKKLARNSKRKRKDDEY